MCSGNSPWGVPPLLAIKKEPELQRIPTEDTETVRGLPTASVHRYHEDLHSCPCCRPHHCRLLHSCIDLPICLRYHTLLLCLYYPFTATGSYPRVFLHQQQVLHSSSCLRYPKEPAGVCQSREKMGAGVHQLFGDELGWKAHGI